MTDWAEWNLPDSDICSAAMKLAIDVSPAFIANHCVRSYLFGRELAAADGQRAGVDYDDELVFLSRLLHDLGVTAHGGGDQRFEVDGAAPLPASCVSTAPARCQCRPCGRQLRCTPARDWHTDSVRFRRCHNVESCWISTGSTSTGYRPASPSESTTRGHATISDTRSPRPSPATRRSTRRKLRRSRFPPT